jgi:hypothetical protein
MFTLGRALCLIAVLAIVQGQTTYYANQIIRMVDNKMYLGNVTINSTIPFYRFGFLTTSTYQVSVLCCQRLHSHTFFSFSLSFLSHFFFFSSSFVVIRI